MRCQTRLKDFFKNTYMIKALEQYTKTYKKDSHIKNGQDMKTLL